MDESAGLRRPFPVSPKDLVADAVNRWIQDYYRKPTHLVVGKEASKQIRASFESMITRHHPLADNRDRFLGLEVIYDSQAGLELLMDCFDLG